MRVLCIALVAVASCGGGSATPSRGQCAELVAHQMTLEDLASLGMNDDDTTAIGKELAGARFDSEKQALDAILVSENGRNQPGEGERRIARCLAERSTANIDCALRSPTLAAIERCPR